ncbi:MAG: pirin family protein [Pseudomonadota bacterium]
MIQPRYAEERGHANFGWLNSRHTFSFGGYHDPNHMGFGPLRVINDDRVAPGTGFDPHGHRDMEIISYVLEGALEHKDSIGNGSVIRPGEVQRMTAGSGIRHSEYNHSGTEGVHFLQIWIMPETQDLKPGYEQKHFGNERRGKLRLVASKEARDGSLKIHRDVDLYAAVLDDGEVVSHEFDGSRLAWVQVASGTVKLNGEQFRPGDGAAVSDEAMVTIEATSQAEILLFDMAE